MLRPEPMTRTLIISSKDNQRALIEALYEAQSAHLLEFNERDDGEWAGFRLGRPLKEGSRASEHLVRLRAIQRHLDLEDHTPTRAYTASEIEAQMDQALVQIETDVTSAVEKRDRIRQALDALDDEEAQLQPFTHLPLNLEDYRGYDSLATFVGRADGAVERDVSAITNDHILFTGDGVIALFVPDAHAEAVADALTRHGYAELEVPTATGAPRQRLEAIKTERAQLERKLQTTRADLDTLRERHADFIAAAEEHLTIQVEKAEAPLAFASTENAFVVEAWVPSSWTDSLTTRLEDATGGNVYIQATPPGDHDHEGGVHGAHEAEEPAHAPEEAPPTKYDNPNAVRPFQFFTSLFSTPRYDEVDPTWVLALIFPFFYGLMIGDFGYGVIMVALGGLMVAKLRHVDAARDLGVALAVAGVVSVITGGFVFADAFGIPFFAHHEAASCAALAAAGETTWACLVANDPTVVEPMVNKLTDVSTLLVFSIIAAFVHLGIGLVFGIINESHHSKKHMWAKVGWLAIMVGFFVQIMFMARFNRLGEPVWALMGSPNAAVTFQGLDVNLVMAGLVGIGAVLLGITEGGIGLLEIPTMLSNMLSYARLAGVAVAKGAMAVAFNSLFLVGMVLEGGSLGIILVGFLLLIVTQLLVFVLGLLSSGIQAIRLNYVEFFTKFYEGGGRPFTPFGRPRKHTTE